jgi:hypothetical protein
MDISDTLAPNSDQLDAVDLIGQPRTFTITKVTAHNAEQPVNVHLAEFPRVWRPGKSMRRVLAACWGTDASAWVGRRVTLYCDESVRFGNDVVGGTRISHLSHIDKPKSVPLLISRGKSATFKVQPLPDEAPAPADLAEQIVTALADATTEAEVREWGNRAHARGLLDIQVRGQVLRDHVTEALAVLAQKPDAEPDNDVAANDPALELGDGA